MSKGTATKMNEPERTSLTNVNAEDKRGDRKDAHLQNSNPDKLIMHVNTAGTSKKMKCHRQQNAC